jgi:hypothetical protein
METVPFFSKSFLAKYVWSPGMGAPLRCGFGFGPKWADTMWYCDNIYNSSTCRGVLADYVDIVSQYMGYRSYSGTPIRTGGAFGKQLPNGSWDGDILEVIYVVYKLVQI